MAERKPSDEQAAFGVFPQLHRHRAQQDREAAKNIPIAQARGMLAGLLGLPSDTINMIGAIRNAGRSDKPFSEVPYGSEHFLETLPLKDESPMGKAMGALGSFTPPVGTALKGAKAAGMGGLELINRGMFGEGPLRNLVPQHNFVVKPKGGNWLGGSVEKVLDPLIQKGIINNVSIPYGPEFDAAALKRIAELKEAASQPNYTGGAGRVAEHLERDINNPRRANEAAMNKWIQSNLTNYVKKDMGTPEDPVRRLAEEGITHLPTDASMPLNMGAVRETRKEAGFPDPYGQSWRGMLWESKADKPIGFGTAGEMINRGKGEPWMEKVDPFTRVHGISPMDSVNFTQDLGFNHIIDVLRQDVASGRIRPEQLNKVSMEQAVRRTYEYDQEMAKKMAETQAKITEGMPIHKEYPEGYKWVELAMPKASDVLPEGWTMLEPKGGVMRAVNPAGDRVIGNDMPELIKNLYYRHPDTPGNPRQILEEALKYEGNTMGHCVGGYCPDVVAGKSRIYSLRDAKGEPHVTVETHPGNLDPGMWYENQPQAVQDAMHAANYRGYNIRHSPQFKAAQAEAPERIVQIKGKGNAKPKEDYLPFVQDFVKGGKWSDIGDFRNTGLIREGDQIMTPAEHADWLLKQLNVPPAEGMKRGGKVSVSNNPDTMMLEVNNRKMAGGGLMTKLLKGAQTAAKVEPEIMKASEALGKIEGRPLVITQADRTKVGEGFLGGPGFSSLQLTEPEYRAAEAAWGVKNAGTAKMILGGAKKAGDNPVFTTMIGSPTQHQSNQMVFDKLYGDFKKAAKKGGLPPELRDKINDRLASAVDKEGNAVFPSDIDILDKNFKDIADTFDRRSIAGHLMGGVQVGGKKGQIIDYDKIIRETTDPALIDVPSGSLGNRMFTLSGGIIDRPDLHPAFPTILQGEDLGVSFNPVARDLLMKDFIEKTMREKGRKPGYMDFTRGHPPSQLITEDILTEMQKLGLKKGGAVHKAEGGEITGDDLIIEERPL
jgi:hypothetical protein